MRISAASLPPENPPQPCEGGVVYCTAAKPYLTKQSARFHRICLSRVGTGHRESSLISRGSFEVAGRCASGYFEELKTGVCCEVCIASERITFLSHVLDSSHF